MAVAPVSDTPLSLTVPALVLSDAFLEYRAEFEAHDEPQFWHPRRDEVFSAYVERLGRVSRGEEPGFVRVSTFWFLRGASLVGESRIRHELPPALAEAGHIGFAVRPTARGAGVGTRILQMTLEQATLLGHSSLLLTCDSDNLASRKVITKNGCHFLERVLSAETGKELDRYSIRLQRRAG